MTFPSIPYFMGMDSSVSPSLVYQIPVPSVLNKTCFHVAYPFVPKSNFFPHNSSNVKSDFNVFATSATGTFSIWLLPISTSSTVTAIDMGSFPIATSLNVSALPTVNERMPKSLLVTVCVSEHTTSFCESVMVTSAFTVSLARGSPVAELSNATW